MRLFSFTFCFALALALPGLAQNALSERLADPTTQDELTDAVKQALIDEANYTSAVRPELFRIRFADAKCLEIYEEMSDATVGTCLLQAGGWQMFSVFAVNFPDDLDGAFGLHPLTIIIE